MVKKYPKIIATIAILTSLAATPATAQISSIKGIQRIGGSDRVTTSIFASRDMLPSVQKDQDGNIIPDGNPAKKIGHVIIAPASSWADSAAATPLAVQLNAPILLNWNSDGKMDVGLLPYVRNEIARILKPEGTIYLVGGEKALNKKIEKDLQNDFYLKNLKPNIIRLQGKSREETAQRMAEEYAHHNNPQGYALKYSLIPALNDLYHFASKDKYYAVKGDDWETALVTGNIAARNQATIIFGKQGVQWAKQTNPNAHITKIGDWGDTWPAEIIPDEDYTSQNPKTLALQLGKENMNSVAFAKAQPPAESNPNSVSYFADSLTGAVASAMKKQGLILTDGKTLDPQLLQQVAPYTQTTEVDTFYGGPNAVTDEVAAQLAFS